MYKTKKLVMNYFVQNVAILARKRNMKLCAQHWHNQFCWCVLPVNLFNFPFSLWTIVDNNSFSRWTTICSPVVAVLLARYRAQNYVLMFRDYLLQRQGRSLWGINACMRVARRDLSPGKGITFTCRKIVASLSCTETSSSGTKSFCVVLQMLNAQSFISSPMSPL